MRLVGMSLAIALPFLVRFALSALLPNSPEVAPSPPIRVAAPTAALSNNVPPIQIDTATYGRLAVEGEDREAVRQWQDSQQLETRRQAQRHR